MKKYLIGAFAGSLLSGGAAFAVTQDESTDVIEARAKVCKSAMDAKLDDKVDDYMEQYFATPPVSSSSEKLKMLTVCLAYGYGYKDGFTRGVSMRVN